MLTYRCLANNINKFALDILIYLNGWAQTIEIKSNLLEKTKLIIKKGHLLYSIYLYIYLQNTSYCSRK